MNRENIVRSIINSIDPKEYDIDDDFDIIKGAFLSEKVVNSYFNKVSPKESSISIKNMINGAFDILIIGVKICVSAVRVSDSPYRLPVPVPARL